jgi:inosine/xanthosine triphosphatase
MKLPKRENFTQQAKELIIVGSLNPVKLQSTEDAFTLAFERSFHITGVNVPSGVSDQPFGAEETLLGAQNRAKSAKAAFPEADYWVGVEGGVEEDARGLFAFAWVWVLDKNGKHGQAKTSTFYLPEKVAELVKGGIELGQADDEVFSEDNSKQKGGSVGILTKGKLNRTEYYQQAVLLALIPFLQKNLYK